MYSKIASFENLLLAFKKASKGKRKKGAVASFELRLESELLQLSRELSDKTYEPGGYHAFTIYDPKERLISAAPFRDRVVHHALCNVIEPIFERSFIFDSYANRKGKGTHKALERYAHYARQYPYVLKCDIRKFFPNIDHALLKKALRRKVGCRDTLWLIDQIIDYSNPQEPSNVYYPGDDLFTPYERRRGLPIGNLTSQFWANVYMDEFDHWIKEVLHVPAYIRYVDDFVVFGHCPQELLAHKVAMQEYLNTIRLQLHPDKSEVYATDHGVPFLGFLKFPYHAWVLKAKTRRFQRHLKSLVHDFQDGKITADRFESSINSWHGHVGKAHSDRLVKRIYYAISRSGVVIYQRSAKSWFICQW